MMIELTGKNGRLVLVRPELVWAVDDLPDGGCVIIFSTHSIQVRESYSEVRTKLGVGKESRL